MAFPTETYYGLAVDPFNSKAVERLFRVKGRSRGQPISLVIDEIKRLEDITTGISPAASILIKKFWPGPLTLILKGSPRLPAALTGGTGKIGVRIPDHPVAVQFVRRATTPLTATSANRSGQPGATTAKAVRESLGTEIDLILDGGTTPNGLESTVVDSTLYPPRLVREGRIPFHDVLEAVGLSPTEDHEW